MSRGTIYLILNKQTGEKYIGNTTLAMNKEWVYHIDRSKRMSSEPLHKALRQYGTHNFMIKELDTCDENLIEEKMNYWIQQYKPEYNPLKEEVITIEEYKPTLQPKEKKKVNTSNLIQWNENTRGDGKKLGLKIRGKNLETGICTEYASAREAATQVTGNPRNNSNILLAAKTGRTAYGHKWQILEEKKKKRAVFGVDKRTEMIGPRCESVNAAVRLFEGTDRNGILKSLKNPGRYSWKGYWWFYG